MQTTPPHFLSSPILRVVAIVILVVVFTMLCVAKSSRIGRLATAPNYDDVVYFHDGAILIQSLKAEGFRGFWSFLDERGLHSPYSVFLAAASFATLGFREAAPYYGDGLLVLGYLICLGWLFRHMTFWAWLASLILFLTPPFITMGVVEFRPDIAWAAATGFGVVFIVTSETLFRSPRRAALAGLFLGLSLCIKPSTFVMTTILYSGAIFSRLIAAIWERRWRSDRRLVLAGASSFVLVSLAVAGPYWARFGKNAWNYFMVNSFGINKAVWLYRGTHDEAIWFYIKGSGYHSNVGAAGAIITAIALACAIWLMVKQPALRWRLFVLLGLISVALFINTVAEMKSPFLGGGIYGVWIFSCAYVIATTYSLTPANENRKKEAWRAAFLALAALAAVCCYRWPEYSDWSNNPGRRENYRAANDFMKELLDQHKAAPPHEILFMQAGPIVMEQAGIWFPIHGLKSVVSSGAFARDLKEFKDIYPKAEWVVLQEQDVMGSSSNMPSEPLLPQFAEIIRNDAEYSILSEFTALDGKKVWVFARHSAQ